VAYLYYVLTDKNGKHAFATTYAQHQANIADARRRGVIK
jgi:cell division protein YceG involved in septum cleavage